MAQTHVSGIVTSSEDGEPVIGATVKVVGSQTAGTVTDIEGRFSLSVSKPGVELEFSSIGLVSKRVKASENMTVVLQVDSHTLEQVVITGYGSAKKLGSVVGSIASVDKKKLESIVTPNFTDALAGQVSGLSVLSGAGDPSQSATIRLRGINSIQSSSQPLFILDARRSTLRSTQHSTRLTSRASPCSRTLLLQLSTVRVLPTALSCSPASRVSIASR